MKQKEQPMATLEPWSTETEEQTSSERRLSRLFRGVSEPEPLGDAARQRVAMRLQRRSTRSPTLMLVRLVAVGAVIGVAGAAAAQWTAARFLGAQREFAAPPSLQAVPLVPPPMLPANPPRPEPVAEPSPPEATPSVALAPPTPVQSSRLGLEAASLEAALFSLRGGAAERALQALDRHLREFPQGALDLEARVARVDACLKLGRRDDALRELSALPLERVGRKLELRLIRAELRADHDCRAALSDFQVLVEQRLPAAWAERALFGRGACLLKLGDDASAARDFSRYLEQFPNGRFAAQIRAQRAR
jgi:hypothetical protein